MEIQTGSFILDSQFAAETTSGDTSTFHQVLFCEPFETDEIVVIPFVQTFNGVHTPGLRITEVNASGFKIRFNELLGNVGGNQFASDGRHLPETIGFIAMKTNCNPQVIRPQLG